MIGPPATSEAAAQYFTYINKVNAGDIVPYLETQLEETAAFLGGIGEEASLTRYAPDKWTIRQVLNHINDTERVFAFRAFWFARGLGGELPSMDQDIAAKAANANEYAWSSHVAEFRVIRESTLAFFRRLPADAWMRTGFASGNPFTIRAMAYIVAGHVAHHVAILRERYL